MGHVDLRRRREGRGSREPEGFWQGLVRNPYVLLGSGFVLGTFAPGALNYMLYPIAPPLLSLVATVVVAALICYAGWLLLRTGSEPIGLKLGSEKQLLLAIRTAGGMTPVEAALETSLTVDEAEEILTRFADRGHLVVQSRDGALFYALPGRTPETRTL